MAEPQEEPFEQIDSLLIRCTGPGEEDVEVVGMAVSRTGRFRVRHPPLQRINELLHHQYTMQVRAVRTDGLSWDPGEEPTVEIGPVVGALYHTVSVDQDGNVHERTWIDGEEQE